MKTVETIAQVDATGLLTAQVPPEIPPGEHKVVLVMEISQPEKKRPPLDFPVHSVGPWPDDLSLRREDLYNDWGR